TAWRWPWTAWRSRYDGSPRRRRVRGVAARPVRAIPLAAPVPPADERGVAAPRAAAGLGGQPLLLPGQHPAQGLGDPVQLPAAARAPPLDPPHRRPRRRGRGGGRDRGLA